MANLKRARSRKKVSIPPLPRPGRDGNSFDLEPEQRKRFAEDQVCMRNIRECPVDYLWKRGSIDDGQKHALDRFRRDCELATIGSVSCPDLGRIPMGKHGAPRGLSDPRLDAIDRISRVNRGVSRTTFMLLDLICIRRTWMKDAARILGLPEKYVGYRFREAVEELAGHYDKQDEIVRAANENDAPHSIVA